MSLHLLIREFPPECFLTLIGSINAGGALDLDWKCEDAKNLFIIAHKKGPANLRILFRTSEKEQSQTHLNGKPITSVQEEIRGVMTQKVDLSLPAENAATIEYPIKL